MSISLHGIQYPLDLIPDYKTSKFFRRLNFPKDKNSENADTYLSTRVDGRDRGVLHYISILGEEHIPVVIDLFRRVGMNKDLVDRYFFLDKSGFTPAHLALYKDQFGLLELYLKSGCPSLIEDKDGGTLYYLAEILEKKDMMDFLDEMDEKKHSLSDFEEEHY